LSGQPKLAALRVQGPRRCMYGELPVEPSLGALASGATSAGLEHTVVDVRPAGLVAVTQATSRLPAVSSNGITASGLGLRLGLGLPVGLGLGLRLGLALPEPVPVTGKTALPFTGTMLKRGRGGWGTYKVTTPLRLDAAAAADTKNGATRLEVTVLGNKPRDTLSARGGADKG
jgi:hypothetical protein